MNKAFLKILIWVVVMLELVLLNTAYIAASPAKIPALMYHNILTADENKEYMDNPWTISVENFDAQMHYLHINGYKTLALDDIYRYLYENKSLPEKSVLITFDDGYYSNIIRAYPVLKKYGFKATIFHITATSEGAQALFSPDELPFIAIESMDSTKDVFEYASHTHALHSISNGIRALLIANHDEVLKDIAKSIRIVDNKIAFAYPGGQYNNDVIDALKEAGIKLAFISDQGYITARSNPYKLNRFTIYNTTSLNVFIDIVEDAK